MKTALGLSCCISGLESHGGNLLSTPQLLAVRETRLPIKDSHFISAPGLPLTNLREGLDGLEL